MSADEFRWSTEAEDRARALVRTITDAAESYPDFLASELPADLSPDALETQLAELGKLSVIMAPLQRDALIRKLLARFPHVPKRPARKIFDTAWAKEQLVRQETEKAAAAAGTAAPADGSGAAGDPAAAGGAAKGKASPINGHVVDRPAGGFYIRQGAEGFARISDFRLVPLKRLAPPAGRNEPDLVVCRVEGIDTSWDAADDLPTTIVAEWTIPNKAWGGKRALIASFPHVKMHWTGTDDEVQALGELVANAAQTLPRMQSTNVLGRHVVGGSPRFVLPAGTLGPDGRWMTSPDILYLPDGGSNLQHRLPRTQADLDAPDAHALAREFLDQVLLLHEPAAMGAIAGWLMATLFGPYLRSKIGCFAILHVYATPGSGKSSLLQLLWPAFTGIDRAELLSCTSSAFAYARDFSSANALALILDEFKPGDMGPKAVEALYRNVRRVYSGDTETRGRADQDVNLYFLIACIALLGEARLEHDQAIAERLVNVPLGGNYLREHPEVRARFGALAGKPLAAVAPLLQSWSVRADADAMFAAAERELARALKKLGRETLPERVRKNLLLVTFGAVALNTAAAALGATVTGDVTLEAILGRALAETLDEAPGDAPGTGRVRDYMDDAVVDYSIMATLGIVGESKHYSSVDGKLRLWIAGLEASREEWRRSRGLPSHSPGPRALKRLAQERMAAGGSYVTGVDMRTPFSDERRVLCIEIDPERIPASLGAETFPVAKEKTWGGTRGKPATPDHSRDSN